MTGSKFDKEAGMSAANVRIVASLDESAAEIFFWCARNSESIARYDCELTSALEFSWNAYVGMLKL